MTVLLAISTSTDHEQVALLDDERVVGVVDTPWRRGQPRRLLATIDDLLRREASPALDLIAADLGPGSFTGLRLGLATARVLAWQGNIPAIGVRATDVILRMARDRGVLGPMTMLLPSRAGHVYSVDVAADDLLGVHHEWSLVDAAQHATNHATRLDFPTIIAPSSTLHALAPMTSLPKDCTFAIERPDVLTLAHLAFAAFRSSTAHSCPPAWQGLQPVYVGVSEAERKFAVDLPTNVLPVLQG